MLRESKNVYDFNASFRHSKGIPSLLQKSDGISQYQRNSWALEEYTKAKEAIAPEGAGLGRRAIMHFLPANTISNPNTLQTALTAYYQERWKQEGNKFMDEAHLILWQAKETNDEEKLLEGLELEKQARVLLGKVKAGGLCNREDGHNGALGGLCSWAR